MSKAGDIGYIATGRLIVRNPHEAGYIKEGWKGENEWEKLVPIED